MVSSNCQKRESMLYPHSDYVSVTLEFRCNLRCVHCMIEGAKDHLKPQTLEQYQAVLEENRRDKHWKGIILTGAEITLRKDLPQLVEMARESCFERIRIQTHGMRLESPDYCERLVDAGVNEFFVSVAGADSESHDAITEIPGAYEKMMKGLDYLERYPHLSIITNTVVTKLSYSLLPDIVTAMQHLTNLVQMEFWVYWPMNENDEKDLIAPHSAILPYLKRAIAMSHERGLRVEVKNFPQCMLGEDGEVLLNDQPLLYIDDAFWPDFMRNGFEQCLYRGQCSSEQCLGLNTAYIKKFGWERELLEPIN